MRKINILYLLTIAVTSLLLASCQGNLSENVTIVESTFPSPTLVEESVTTSEEPETEILSDSTGNDTSDDSAKSPEITKENDQSSSENVTESQEISSSEYNIDIEVNCIENLLFSRYDVNVYVDNVLQGALEHGETDIYTVHLKEGVYTVRFVKDNDETVIGETEINVSKNDAFKFEIYCTALKINVENISRDILIEQSEEIVSEYEKAFVRRGRAYDIYHMFDVDNQTMIYFTTNESGVMEGTYSGDFSDGVTMTWEDGGETWTEKFIHQEGSTKAVWVDHIGVEYSYEVCDIATAQRALDEVLGMRAPVQTTTTTAEVSESMTDPKEEQSSYITIDNNENFAELMRISDQADSTTIKNLLKLIKKEGKIVEFDGCVVFLMQHENYKTRFDVLVVGGDYRAERVYGPLFTFENVSFYDMNVSGTDIVDGGTNFHIIAKLEGFNDEGNYVILDPIELKVR